MGSATPFWASPSSLWSFLRIHLRFNICSNLEPPKKGDYSLFFCCPTFWYTAKTLFTLLCILFGNFTQIKLIFSCPPDQQRPQQHLQGISIKLETTILKNKEDQPLFIVLLKFVSRARKSNGYSYLSGLTTSMWCIRKTSPQAKRHKISLLSLF